MSGEQRNLCWIGAVAAGVAVAADLALQYTGDSSHVGSKDYLFLLDVPLGRMLFGHFAGVIAVLLEILGFWGVARGLEGRRLRGTFFAVSALAFGVGAAFHAMFAGIGTTLRFAAESGATPAFLSGMAAAVRGAHEGLGSITLAGILVLSLLFSVPVALGRTRYPRWAALASPLPVALVLGVLARALPSLRLVVIPAGLNFANFVFFTIAALRSQPRGDVRPAAK